jgi:ABC-2 type transport system ATP-binding protein
MAADPRPSEPTTEGSNEPASPPADGAPAPAADGTAAPEDGAAAPAADGAAAPDADRPADPAPTRPAGSHVDGDLIVEMHGVSRRFDGREVISGLELAVPRGTILGVIGPSGAGKTTTIRMLTGAIRPTTGEVSVMGRSPQRFRRVDRERIGYMPQSFALYEDLTAGENIDFVASLFGMLWRRRRRRVREVLKIVDLWDVRGRQAGKLSGGMQRRLELACALVHEPELIILDEPTAGIDPLLRGSIWEELHRLRNAGRTLLVTTQHISEADECDSVAMIVGGRIIALAPPDELRRLATNGDLLEIETAALYDGAALEDLPGVRDVSQVGPRQLRIVVDDAGTSLPHVVDRIKSSGVEVVSAREQRLSFDEIFAILVARSEEQRATEVPPSGGPSDPARPMPPDRKEDAA